jgi:hypothetical protein
MRAVTPEAGNVPSCETSNIRANEFRVIILLVRKTAVRIDINTGNNLNAPPH